MNEDEATSKKYHHQIPSYRLGIRHESLESYIEIQQQLNINKGVREFSLVVILSPDAHLRDGADGSFSRCPDQNNGNVTSKISILLGEKLRGFGKGFYNCFGGKLEKSEHPAKGAVREVHEETGIVIPLPVMEEGFVGNINFTFEDSDVNQSMKVHLYCVFVLLSDDVKLETSSQNGTDMLQAKQQQYAHTPVTVHPNEIRGCDEIKPRWFHNIYGIPLKQMFADDSIWLTNLLTHYNDGWGDKPPRKFMFDAWFHFHPGGTQTNSIMHYFMRSNTNSPVSNTPSFTFEKRLFHALHINHIHSPSIKEFNENWTMANAVRSFMKEEERMEYVIDVAGGHGALGALFLLLVPTCHTAIVVDPAKCASGKKGVREAWSRFWLNGNNTMKKKELRYRHECLRTGLREELNDILRKTKSTKVTVVACHACQHLTDETLQIASDYGVNVAVMPCCQKDHDGWWKGLTNRLVSSDSHTKNASLSIGAIMDLLAAGKMMGWETGKNAGVRYQVKMKLMKDSITLQNRMILCRAVSIEGDSACNDMEDRKKELAHMKLTRAYKRAHKLPSKEIPNTSTNRTGVSNRRNDWSVPSLLTGFCVGTALSFLVASRLRKK